MENIAEIIILDRYIGVWTKEKEKRQRLISKKKVEGNTSKNYAKKTKKKEI